MIDTPQDLSTALQQKPETLAHFSLWKALPETEKAWPICGIASDELMDVEGDTILRKALDVSYAQQRGYVNWDHSRAPEDQLGHLTKIQVLNGHEIDGLESVFETPLSKSASVYIEGELYKSVPKAQQVRQIMQSAPPGKGLGLSLDGVMARDSTNGNVVRAYVRGVAITPAPVQIHTLARLKKSLKIYDHFKEGTPSDLIGEIASAVVDRLHKALPAGTGLSRDQAVLFVLRQRPDWTYERALSLVQHTINRVNEAK